MSSPHYAEADFYLYIISRIIKYIYILHLIDSLLCSAPIYLTELAVDRLLVELSEEKQERASLERATQNQAVEFLARLEKLQRYVHAYVTTL